MQKLSKYTGKNSFKVNILRIKMQKFSNYKIVAIFLTFIILAGIVTVLSKVQPKEYYVSLNGNNNNSGSFDSPWKNLKYALNKLSPGDVLYLRGGIYYEHDLKTSLKGSASSPITIRSYPGERALIDGGFPYLETGANSEWELVDSSIDLYRSKRTFSGKFVRAWLIDKDVQIIEYETEGNLESVNYDTLNGMQTFYMGPGVQLREDNRVYIRLRYNPNDLTDALENSIDPILKDINPNKNNISVSTSQYIFLLDNAGYLHFKDIDFAHSEYILDVRNGSSNIQLSECRLNYGSYGIVIRNNICDWKIKNCQFNNGLPDYVYWTDVKNGAKEVAEAYPEFQSAAISGTITGFKISHNLFHNTFDALMIKAGSIDVQITGNIFKHIRDDAINLSKGIKNVEVAYNLFWQVGSGISNLGSNEKAGQVYIHHNIIDNSIYQRGGRPGNYRENRWPVWTVIDPFGSHDKGDKASWWKIYNNTIVTRRSGYRKSPAGPRTVTGNNEKYVYNNIFYVIDDRIVFGDELASQGTHYDGNVVYRNISGELPLFVNFGDGNNYYSLNSFREKSGTDWEVNGLQVDPGFKVSIFENTEFDLIKIIERYRPTNHKIFSIGVSYKGLNWPGTKGVNYRGAVSPNKENPFPIFANNIN